MGLNEDVLRFLNLHIQEVEDGPSIMMQAKTERSSRGPREHGSGNAPVAKDDSTEKSED
jgi:small subunit ribosomal protein S6